MSFLDQQYREIITKAVIGKGRKFRQETDIITPAHRPSSILGCWIINHHYHAKLTKEDTVEIRGSYDANIWYAYNDNTKTEVITERMEYCDTVTLTIRDKQHFGEECDVIAKVIQQPNCLECRIDKKGNKIKVDVEREFLVEVIGETKVCVKVDPKCKERETEDWDLAISDEELEELDPDFLDDKEEE